LTTKRSTSPSRSTSAQAQLELKDGAPPVPDARVTSLNVFPALLWKSTFDPTVVM
jgi:hypothetical protein